MTAPYLFIGGPKDGERCDVIDGVRVVRVHDTTYRRFQIGNFDEPPISVFVPDGTDPRDVCHMILDGYRQPKLK